MIAGLLWTFGGIVAVAISNLGEVIRGVPVNGEIGGAFALFPLVLPVIGLLHIVAGTFIWAHRGWARYLGSIFAALGTLLGLFMIFGALGPRGGSQPFALELSLIVLVPYVIAFVGLILGGAHFRRAH